MGATEMCEQIKTKPGQAVLVGNHQGADLAADNVINKRQKLWTLEVEPATNLTHPLRDSETACRTKLFQHRSLICKVRLLCLTGHAHTDHHVPLCRAPMRQHLI